MSSPPSNPAQKSYPQSAEQPSPSKKVRRFAPEPVEISTRSNRKVVLHADGAQGAKHEPEKESASSGLGQESSTAAEEAPVTEPPPSPKPKPAKRRFAPQPVETSTRSNRKQANVATENEAERTSPQSKEKPVSGSKDVAERPRRKFAPQLIETARRSRKSGDTLPAVLESDKTNVSPGDKPGTWLPYRPKPTSVPLNTPTTSLNNVPQLNKSLPHPRGSLRLPNPHRYGSRQHSFKVPDLPKIDSSESEESGGGRSRSVSQSNDSQTSDEAYKDATRLRESQDDRFSGYLLQLAARAAEKQLREQAAAAFVNSDYHEGVAHYMDHSGSEKDISEERVDRQGHVTKRHRDSEEDNWALKEMQRLGEEKFQKKPIDSLPKPFDPNLSKKDPKISPSARTPFVERVGGAPNKIIGGLQRDAGLNQMRKAASPPMLGGSIDFPRCPSPENARFDVTQGADFLKNAMLLSDQKGPGALWGQAEGIREKSPSSIGVCGGATWGAKRASPRPQTPNSGEQTATGAGGLWGGFCTDSDNKYNTATPVGLITPIRTPINERDDPFGSVSVTMHADSTAIAPPRHPTGPLSPPNSFDKRSSHVAAMQQRLEVEEQVEDEFSDAFVTQVYNYLSIGYPTIAKKYDDELARIARIPVEQLQLDDRLAQARGYIRLGSNEIDIFGEQVGLQQNTIVTEDMCVRWRALRSYVREWGRQMITREKEGKLSKPDPHRAWGIPARKGSWGL